MPARPDRSVVNGVVYEDPSALIAARERLAAAYDHAGVFAWTVWARPGDEEVPRALRDAGHKFDGQPMLMAGVLDEMDLEPRFAVDFHREPTWGTVARINDVCYGLDPLHSFADAFAGIREQAYVAELDGRPVACVAVCPHEGDCGIYFVATLPEARGRGLAGALMRIALREAREQGCETTSLEATAMGEPVYAALGYRSLGRLTMWERRRLPATV